MCSGLAANPDYLFIRLLLHLLLLAVRLWVHQASPIHLLWFEGAIWRTALRGGSGGFPRLRAQVNATIPLAAFKTLLCKARNVLKPQTPTQLHKGGKKKIIPENSKTMSPFQITFLVNCKGVGPDLQASLGCCFSSSTQP